ncbi:TlpA family protein disulfide reductase [bacterium]|nr:TlpA family protein disulfide reductase [bacterium]
MNANAPTPPSANPASNKKLLAVFLVFAALLYVLIFGWDCGGPAGLSVMGERVEAKGFTLPDMSGKPVSLADLRGKVVFLNFWATWCAPCRREMPDIQRLYRKMDPEQFAIVTVSVDSGGREDVARFFRSRQLEVPALLDPENKVARIYGVTGFPETFLIDKQGKLVERFIGPRNWLSDSFMERYRELIGE